MSLSLSSGLARLGRGAAHEWAEDACMQTHAEPLLQWRKEFPILSRCNYLISNSLGAMPAGASTGVATYIKDWSEQGVLAWDRWLALVDTLGGLVAPLIGASAGHVMMQPNVSTAQWILISCLDFGGRRNKIVYSALEFPTIHYAWQAQAERGARMHIVPSRDGLTVDVQAFVDAIDETTIAVPLSHVFFRSSSIADVKPIVEKAHAVGAYVFLDVYQSVGVVPVDAQALGVDAVVGGCLKWLCGGPGAAFLYVPPDRAAALRPTNVGWFSHARPFDFSIGPLEFAANAWRYAGGTSNPAALYAARAGLEIVNQIGVETIRRRSLQLTDRVMLRADELGVRVATPRAPEQRGGHVTIDFPGAREACDALIRRQVLVDFRPDAGIRISPHFYNTEEEIDAAFAEVRSIIEKS
jgi:kynureninase